MQLISRILMGIGILGVLAGLACITGLVLFSLTPPIKSDMKVVQVSAKAAKSYNDKLAAFKSDAEKAAVAKETRDLVFSINEEEVNSKLIEIIAEGELPLQEAIINFTDDKVWVYAVLSQTLIPVKIGMTGTVGIVRNSIFASVDDFEMGRLPLPNSIHENVNNITNVFVKMQAPFDNTPVKITSISVSNNILTFRATTIPRP